MPLCQPAKLQFPKTPLAVPDQHQNRSIRLGAHFGTYQMLAGTGTGIRAGKQGILIRCFIGVCGISKPKRIHARLHPIARRSVAVWKPTFKKWQGALGWASQLARSGGFQGLDPCTAAKIQRSRHGPSPMDDDEEPQSKNSPPPEMPAALHRWSRAWRFRGVEGCIRFCMLAGCSTTCAATSSSFREPIDIGRRRILRRTVQSSAQ